MKKLFVGILMVVSACAYAATEPVDYVSTLVGTLSKNSLSTCNTYPAIAMPWGMNFWTPQTGRMGDGWQYVYTEDKIRGLKQTHQPSPWINDYGQFAIMATTGSPSSTKTSGPPGSRIKPRRLRRQHSCRQQPAAARHLRHPGAQVRKVTGGNVFERI